MKTTDEHPVWSEDRQDWIDAADLNPREELRTLRGEEVTVTRVASYLGAQTMYNLTVADIHTYYVLAGKTPVLVHNTGPCGGDKWTSGSNLDDHFDKHGPELGYQTKSEYDYAARDLMCLCDGRRPGVQIKRDGGTQYYFDPKSGEFGITGNNEL